MSDGQNVYVSRYNDINWSEFKPLRGGIIPYMVVGTPYFIMGIDSKHNDIASFSGGIKYVKNREDAPTGALRELKEEGLGVFGNISVEEIPPDAPVIYDNEMMIIFLHVQIDDFATLRQEFRERYYRYNDEYVVEICDIIIMSGYDFLQIVRNDASFFVDDKEVKIYSLLRLFLAANLSFIDML